MNLLRIGDRVINLDNVTEVYGLGGSVGVSIYFNVATGCMDAGEGKIEQEFTTLTGDEADALRAYFQNTHIATDVMKPYRAAQTQEPAIVVGACECSACNKEVR